MTHTMTAFFTSPTTRNRFIEAVGLPALKGSEVSGYGGREFTATVTVVTAIRRDTMDLAFSLGATIVAE